MCWARRPNESRSLRRVTASYRLPYAPVPSSCLSLLPKKVAFMLVRSIGFIYWLETWSHTPRKNCSDSGFSLC